MTHYIVIYNITYLVFRLDWSLNVYLVPPQASHSSEQAQKNSPVLGLQECSIAQHSVAVTSFRPSVPVSRHESTWVDMSRHLYHFDNLDIHIVRTFFWQFLSFFEFFGILCSSFDGRWGYVRQDDALHPELTVSEVQSSDTTWQGELAQGKHQCNQQQLNDNIRTQYIYTYI